MLQSRALASTHASLNLWNSDMGDALVPHCSSRLASPALRTGSPGTHIPWCSIPAISVPLILPLGVTPDPQPGSRCGAASRWPRPSSLPLFLGRGIAPAHVPAPPAPASGGRAELRLLRGGEDPVPRSSLSNPPVRVLSFSARGTPGALCPPLVPSCSSLPRSPPKTPPVAHASCIRDEVSSAAAERGRARV